jgi:hypothetical protein
MRAPIRTRAPTETEAVAGAGQRWHCGALPDDACAQLFCGCDGVTFRGGCGWLSVLSLRPARVPTARAQTHAMARPDGGSDARATDRAS